MEFTLAHISDLHIGPVTGFRLRDWGFKRVTGLYNWHQRRRHAHLPETLAAIVADLKAQTPDHIAVTGDLTNLGLPSEIERAERWLRALGSGTIVTAIPGNHDIYVRMRGDPGVARWGAYMQDLPATATSTTVGPWPAPTFPFVRRLGRVALVGLNSAAPMPPFIAAGHLGAAQLDRLRTRLSELRAEGLARVVLIHHPPLVGQAPLSRGLRDAAELQRVLSETGAELILHGHNHIAMQASWPGPSSAIPVIGVPSASMGQRYKHEHLARYHLYRIKITDTGTVIELVARGLKEPGAPVVEIERRQLMAR